MTTAMMGDTEVVVWFRPEGWLNEEYLHVRVGNYSRMMENPEWFFAWLGLIVGIVERTYDTTIGRWEFNTLGRPE